MNLNMAIVLTSFFKVDFVLYLDISLTMAEKSFFENRLKHNIAVVHYIHLCKTLICIFAFTLNAPLLGSLFPMTLILFFLSQEKLI